MGNLFHEPVGASLTKDMWEATGTNTGKHLFGPTVAAGDLPYAATSASTGVALSALAIGATGTVLTSSGSPAVSVWAAAGGGVSESTVIVYAIIFGG